MSISHSGKVDNMVEFVGKSVIVLLVIPAVIGIVAAIWGAEAWAAGAVYNVVTGTRDTPDITFWEMYGIVAFVNLCITPIFRSDS